MGVGSDAEVADLVEAGAVLEQVATGFLFTEGPIWCDGGLLFSDMPSDKRRRWTPEGGVEVVRDPCNRCNGMTLDDDGGLIVCEHNTSVVVRERPDGTREIVASHYEGKELNSPNDVIVARDGSIVFTDPTYGRTVEAAGLLRPLELGFQGVYRIAPDGGLELLADDFEQPNGLCLSADEQLLYVNDTTRGHGRVFAHVGGDGEVGQPDGMKLDERGNVYVTGPGGVVVFAPSGERIGLIEVPEVVGNLNWGDADYRTLYLAASSSIYRLRMAVAGNRVGYMA